MEERWLPIAEFEGLYDVSDHGRVRSLTRMIPRSSGVGMQSLNGRLLKHQKGCGGYLHVSLSKLGVVYQRSVQCLVLETFIGPRPSSSHQACHGPDPNPANCALSNLRWDTISNNQKDRLIQGGRDYRGSTNGNAKIIEGDVERMRDIRLVCNATNKQIAEWIGVSDSNISMILKGKAWQHTMVRP